MQNTLTTADECVCSISNAMWGPKKSSGLAKWSQNVFTGSKLDWIFFLFFFLIQVCFYLKYYVILSCFCTDAKSVVHLLRINLIFWFASKLHIKRNQIGSSTLHLINCIIQKIHYSIYKPLFLISCKQLLKWVIVTLFHWLPPSPKLHLYTVSWCSPKWLMWWKKLIMKAVSQMIFTHKWSVSTVEKLIMKRLR